MNSPLNLRFQSIAMIFERSVRLVGGVFVSVAIARYLGPDQLGLLVYAQTVVVILVVLSAAGTDVISLKWFMSGEFDDRSLLVNIAFLRLILATIIQIILLILLLQYYDDDIRSIAILGAMIFFSSFDSVQKLYESRGRGHVAALARFIGFIVSAALKIIFVFYEMSFDYFLYAIIAESFVIMCFVGCLHYKEVGISKGKVLSVNKMYKLAKQSSPLVISTVTALAYNSVAIFLIKYIMDDRSVGIYSVATRLSEAWFSLLSVAVVSIAPKIIVLAAESESESEYEKKVSRIYGFAAYVCIAVALFVTCISEWVIPLLFGEVFSDASGILMLHIWAGVFVVWRQISGQFLIANNQVSQHVKRFVFGLIFNISLCLLLIPLWGLLGAAVASLTSHIFVGYIFDLLYKTTRRHFILKTFSLVVKKS